MNKSVGNISQINFGLVKRISHRSSKIVSHIMTPAILWIFSLNSSPEFATVEYGTIRAV